MYEKQEELDWNEPALQRWLTSISKESTRRSYKVAFRRYAKFTGLTASQLIDEALEDAKLDERVKKDIVKQRLLGFYDALKKDGLSSFYCNTSVQSIRSFYQTFNITVRLKGRSKLPKVKAKNRRLMITPEILRKLLDNTRSLRDRSILTMLFQSGMDIATLCSLTYGDVAQGLSEDLSPMKIEVQRPKTGTDYYTFIGRDSIEALKIYINDLKSRGFNFNDNSPLFFVEGHQSKKFKPLTPNLIQNALRDLALRTGYLKDTKDRNVISPHSFRESFSSILLNNNVPDSIVDFLLGHEIGTMGEAYKKTDFENVKRMYAQIEPKLSIGNGNGNRKIAKVEEMLDVMMEVMRDLVRDKLQEKGLMKTKPVNWEEIYEKLIPESERKEEVSFT